MGQGNSKRPRIAILPPTPTAVTTEGQINAFQMGSELRRMKTRHSVRKDWPRNIGIRVA